MRVVLPLVLMLGACTATQFGDGDGAVASGTAPPVTWRVAGTSVEGRPIEYAELGTGGETVLVIATIHGDEAAATPLLYELAARLACGPAWLAGRRVVVVPTVNPDGAARRSRSNARGVDLNRNFPAENFRARGGAEPLSEPESLAVFELVERYAPERILSFHQAAELIDYDGPAAELAAALAAVSPLAVERMGARPGSLGSWAGVDRRIATITVELPRSDDGRSAAELWELYGPLLARAVAGGASE